MSMNTDDIRKAVILDLKQRAKESKDQNDKAQALEWLKWAKQISEEEDLVMKLKQLAVYFKQKGDLDGAKNYLIRSKHVQQQQQQQQQLKENNESITEEETTSTNNDNATETPSSSIDDVPNADENDDSLLQDLNDNATTTYFTDEEMMDEAIMVEFQLGGMAVPSQEDYTKRIIAYKQAALRYKQAGNIPQASGELRKAKQLQQVQRALANGMEGVGLRINEDDLDGWMETLNAEESALLGELLTTKDTKNHTNTNESDGFQNVMTNELGVDDIATMTDEDIQEFIALGTALPCPKELQRQATEEQKKAVDFKQAGNIDLAKVALLESKKLAAQAERLERIQSNNTNDNNDDDFEALVLESSNSGSPKTKKQPPTNPWLDKSSKEMKEEVLRLKKENQIQEATKLLQIYKTVLAKEAQAKEMAARQAMAEEIKEQLEVCEVQQKLFTFYQRFVDDTPTLVLDWYKYHAACQKALRRVPTGATSIGVSDDDDGPFASLKLLEDDVCGIVQHGTLCPLNNGLIEIAVLEIIGVDDNKSFQKFMKQQNPQIGDTVCPKLEVDVKLNLPCSELPDSSLLHPSNSQRNGAACHYQFHNNNSIQIPLPEDETSREAKRFLQRLETKKLQLGVTVTLPDPNNNKGGWFSSRKKQPAEEKPKSFLGRVTLEWNALLKENCIAEDFPLVLNSKEVGGKIRLAIRTKEPLDLEQYEGSTTATIPELSPYANALSFIENDNK